MNNIVTMKKALLLLALFITFVSNAQTLTVNEVIAAPHLDADNTDELLKKKGWEQYSYEINKDSGFVKRTWMIKNNYNDLKSYFTYFQSDVDTLENHTLYQYSDRDAYNSYKASLKKLGYKLIADKKKKGKKKKDKSKSKDKEEVYSSEKTKSLIVLKEVFLLGFNAFLIESYNAKSQLASRILDDKTN